MDIGIILIISYILGSIPFGLLLAQMAGIGDIRQAGSGNIGATNALRLGGKALGAATLLCDGAKGALAVIMALHIGASGFDDRHIAVIAAVVTFCGHIWPVWLRFRGGKGVAVGLGALLGLSWPVGLAVCLTWLAAAIWSRYSSLAALTAFSLAPFYAWLLGDINSLIAAMVMGVGIWWRHRDNLLRLRNKTEGRIGHPGKAEHPSDHGISKQ